MSIQDFVRSTYQYVLVTGNWYILGIRHEHIAYTQPDPGSALRVKDNSVHLLFTRCDRMTVMTSNFKKCIVQVTQVHTIAILVYDGTYWYRDQLHTRFISTILHWHKFSDAYESPLNAWLVPRAAPFLLRQAWYKTIPRQARLLDRE